MLHQNVGKTGCEAGRSPPPSPSRLEAGDLRGQRLSGTLHRVPETNSNSRVSFYPYHDEITPACVQAFNSAARPIRPYDRSTSPHIGLYSPNLPSPDFSIQHEYLSIGPTIDVCYNTHASQNKVCGPAAIDRRYDSKAVLSKTLTNQNAECFARQVFISTASPSGA